MLKKERDGKSEKGGSAAIKNLRVEVHNDNPINEETRDGKSEGASRRGEGNMTGGGRAYVSRTLMGSPEGTVPSITASHLPCVSGDPRYGTQDAPDTRGPTW